MKNRKNMGYLAFLFVLFILFFPMVVLKAQFKEVQVIIEANRIQGQDREDLKQLNDKIVYYFQDYQWVDDPFGMEIGLTIHISAESVDKTGFERLYSARMFLTNTTMDMKFLDRNFTFAYNSNEPLIHQEIYHSLTSVLDFWAYMYIAHEMDTYDILAGTPAYERARSIATRYQQERGATGWKDRLEILDQLSSNRPYRIMKSDYYYALYLLEEGKFRQATQAMISALDNLEKVTKIDSREKWTSQFLDAHAREWMQTLITLQDQKLQQRLLSLDPYRKDIYEQIMKKKQ